MLALRGCCGKKDKDERLAGEIEVLALARLMKREKENVAQTM